MKESVQDGRKITGTASNIDISQPQKEFLRVLVHNITKPNRTIAVYMYSYPSEAHCYTRQFIYEKQQIIPLLLTNTDGQIISNELRFAPLSPSPPVRDNPHTTTNAHIFFVHPLPAKYNRPERGTPSTTKHSPTAPK